MVAASTFQFRVGVLGCAATSGTAVGLLGRLNFPAGRGQSPTGCNGGSARIVEELPIGIERKMVDSSSVVWWYRWLLSDMV